MTPELFPRLGKMWSFFRDRRISAYTISLTMGRESEAWEANAPEEWNREAPCCEASTRNETSPRIFIVRTNSSESYLVSFPFTISFKFNVSDIKSRGRGAKKNKFAHLRQETPNHQCWN